MSQSTVEPLPVPGPPRRIWSRLILLGVTFCGGGVVGAVGGIAYTRDHMLAVIRHPEQVPDRIFGRIRTQLGLSAEQATKVEAIVRRRHAAMEAIRAESHPQQVSEFQALRDEVAEVLTAAQRENWLRLCETIQERYLPMAPSPPLGPPPADFLFRRFDANRDGALTEEEVPPRMWMHLRNADADGDGRITLAEYQAAVLQGVGR